MHGLVNRAMPLVVSGRESCAMRGDQWRGDSFFFAPGEAHQLRHLDEVSSYVVADNPRGDSCYYPDSGKWVVFKEGGEDAIAKGVETDYYDGEE